MNKRNTKNSENRVEVEFKRKSFVNKRNTKNSENRVEGEFKRKSFMNKRHTKNSERVEVDISEPSWVSAPSAATAPTSAQPPASSFLPRQRSVMMVEIARAWGAFLLPYPWHLITHLTFLDSVHPEQAGRRFERWIAALEHHPGRRRRGPIIWVRGAESQRRDALHFHALLAGTAGIAPFAAMRLWERIGRGSARVFLYAPDRGGAHYISKGGDIEVSAVWFGDARS